MKQNNYFCAIILLCCLGSNLATFLRDFKKKNAAKMKSHQAQQETHSDQESSKLATEQATCLEYFWMVITTGSYGYDGATITATLTINGKQYSSSVWGLIKDTQFGVNYPFNTFSPQLPSCVQQSDITNVVLTNSMYSSWQIKNIQTAVGIYNGNKKYPLTNDPNTISTSNSQIELTILVHTPRCGYGTPVCECTEAAKECVFNLEVDEIRTFTSYQKFPVGEEDGMFVRGAQGVIYEINDNGDTEYLEQYKTRLCAASFSTEKCSEPQFVDGKTFRMATGVNGQIPGPTIIVHEDQMVTIHVYNNMSSEGISIHWHGMHQKGTPWMDGVGQVTQCQIGPSSSFSYVYKANPSGTFWYHSHTSAQRTDGLYSALIVKEKSDRLQKMKLMLKETTFEDHPDKHTISLLDWQPEASLDLFTQLNAGLGFYLDTPNDEVPPNKEGSRYESTRSYENAEVGPVPYFSGLINGKGRHSDVPYIKTRLSVFPVESGKKYRFRLIGAQGLYAYKFSIDGHKLTVVGTDGYWTQKTQPADYIIIHTGERYDFILETDQKFQNYWIRAETLEINRSSNGGKPPFESLGHVAEGILEYTSDITKQSSISSSQYLEIKNNSPVRECCPDKKCLAVNCPFGEFHSSYYTECLNVHQLRLLEETPSDELPSADPGCKDCIHFFNFNFEGDSETSSVNGRNFILPPAPPQTQPDAFKSQAKICDPDADCNPSTLACLCTNVVDIPQKNKTIQFVFSAIGAYLNAHPIHLHGHTFHVVDVGYPDYDDTTGFITQQSQAIQCGDCKNGECVQGRCTEPSWNPDYQPILSINQTTARKDTVYVPAGGYVVINFISDNPGYWFLHCHIEVHQLEGMAVVINEAGDDLQNPPPGLNKCGDFDLSVQQFLTYTTSNVLDVGVAE